MDINKLHKKNEESAFLCIKLQLLYQPTFRTNIHLTQKKQRNNIIFGEFAQ